MTSVYFACRFQQGMQLHVIAAFQLCPIHAALSAPCGQTVSPATHHALQLELGGRGGDAGVSASLSISPFLIISWCLIAALTVSPTWAFPAPPCYFKSRRHGESMSHPPPPARSLAHGCDQGWLQKETAGCCWAQALLFDCRWQARQLEHHTSPETNLTVEHFLFRSGSLCRKEDDSREGSHRGGKHSQELRGAAGREVFVLIYRSQGRREGCG